MNEQVTRDKASLTDYLKTWPLYLLPQHWLSSLMHRFMRIRARGFKNLQIRSFIRVFKVNMEEAKIDPGGHILRIGGKLMPFGWFIPFKEKECFNLLSKQVEAYQSKPLYLAYALPPSFLTVLFALARHLEGLFPPELWAVLWGVTTAISLTMIAYSFPVEIRLGSMNRGVSAIICGIFAGVTIAIINIL